MKDLSQKPGTIAYEFVKILERLYIIQGSEKMKPQEKRDECLVLAINALNNASSLSDVTFARKRTELMNCTSDSEIVRVVEKTIEHGNNYGTNLEVR